MVPCTKQMSLDARLLKCMYPPAQVIGLAMTLIFDLWPLKLFQQCSLT